jgi:hypothetical protein
MRYQVPQFIDIEDKIAFQLTAKQLGWFGLGGVILFVLWNFLSFGLFIFFGIMTICASAGLAFIKIKGVSLLEYFGHSSMFFFKPRIFIWRKTVSSAEGLYQKAGTDLQKNNKTRIKKKEIEDLDKIVNILNSQ